MISIETVTGSETGNGYKEQTRNRGSTRYRGSVNWRKEKGWASQTVHDCTRVAIPEYKIQNNSIHIPYKAHVDLYKLQVTEAWVDAGRHKNSERKLDCIH